MKKMITILAALTLSTSAFARGEKTTFQLNITGASAQQAYDSAQDMASTIENAGPGFNSIKDFSFFKIRRDCYLSNSVVNQGGNPFMERHATLVKLDSSVDLSTGMEIWTATLKVSCEQ